MKERTATTARWAWNIASSVLMLVGAVAIGLAFSSKVALIDMGCTQERPCYFANSKLTQAAPPSPAPTPEPAPENDPLNVFSGTSLKLSGNDFGPDCDVHVVQTAGKREATIQCGKARKGQ